MRLGLSQLHFPDQLHSILERYNPEDVADSKDHIYAVTEPLTGVSRELEGPDDECGGVLDLTLTKSSRTFRPVLGSVIASTVFSRF